MYRITADTEPRCRNALKRKLPTPCTGSPTFSSRLRSSSRNWESESRSVSSVTTACCCSRSWLIGTHTPLIFTVIGDPADRKRSDAFFSAISWNSRSSPIV